MTYNPSAAGAALEGPAQWLSAELRLVLPTVRCVVVLGSFGWAALGRAITIA